MATQTSGNGSRRGLNDQRSRDRDDLRMRMDHDDRDRGRSESDDERDWRGRGDEGGERWREQRLSSWDQDRGGGFDRGRERGEDRGAWDQRGDQMYGAGQSRRDQFGDNEYLDDGRFEQRPRGFDQRLERDRYGGDYGGRISGGHGRGDSNQGMYGGGQSGYGAGASGNIGRGGYYGQQGTGFGDRGYGYGQADRGGYGHGSQDPQRGQQGYVGYQGGYNQGYNQDRQLGRQQHQQQIQPSHRGKGPQGYSRSDDRIKEDVNEALTQDHDIDASSIEVQVRQGEVTLTGTVPDRRMKRLAEDCVENLPGVKDVQNSIKVQADTERGKGSSSQGSQQVDTSSTRKPSKDAS